eukprot:1147864-Pelagomonas_calceolata.AAC.2
MRLIKCDARMTGLRVRASAGDYKADADSHYLVFIFWTGRDTCWQGSGPGKKHRRCACWYQHYKVVVALQGGCSTWCTTPASPSTSCARATACASASAACAACVERCKQQKSQSMKYGRLRGLACMAACASVMAACAAGGNHCKQQWSQPKKHGKLKVKPEKHLHAVRVPRPMPALWLPVLPVLTIKSSRGGSQRNMAG